MRAKFGVGRLVLAVPIAIALVGFVGVHDTRQSRAAPSLPTLWIGDTSVVEGDSGDRFVAFAVTLSRPATTTVTVDYLLEGQWGVTNAGRCGITPNDFDSRGLDLRQLKFPLRPSGTTAVVKYISVEVCGDTEPETDEAFTAALSNASGGIGIVKARAQGTIIDDDAGAGSPKASIGDAEVSEGDSVNRSARLAVTLSQPRATTTVVSYRIASAASGRPASCGAFAAGTPVVAGTDCWDRNGAIRSLVFAPGRVTRPVDVVVAPDADREYDENFVVNLISVSDPAVTLGLTIGRGTITNDDAACGNGQNPPARYDSVVVFALENRTWGRVGTRFADLPYLHQLAQECSSFASWSQADIAQSSMTQYGAQITGELQPMLVNNCDPSPTCSTSADNIFRQARTSGMTAINFVEGAQVPCSAGLAPSTTVSWVEWVPALYLWNPDDRANCVNQVRPYSEFDPDNLPEFAFVSPTACHNGHEIYTCGRNADVDAWARANIEPVLQSAAYRAGRVAVFVWYDEYDPVPNLQIAPTAIAGPNPTAGIGYASTLAAWESMLGLPCLANACSAPDLRAPAGI